MLALTMIVKGVDSEAAHLKDCLENITRYVDGIFINLNHPDGTPEPKITKVVKQYATDYIVSKWTDHFADARNAIKVPKDYEWILWLDSDDTVEHPEKLRPVIEKSDGFDSLHVYYDYDHDQYGNITTQHLNLRLYRNNGSYSWKGRIHETPIATRPVKSGMTNDLKVVHHAKEARRESSLVRNIVLLEKQLAEEKSADPRTMFYLAGSYIDAGQDDKAKELLELYVAVSGWDEERSQAYVHLARIAKRQDQPVIAKNHLLAAIGESPTDPEPAVELGQLELEAGDNQKAVFWLTQALNLPDKATTLVTNPTTRTYRARILLAQAYINIGGSELEKALEQAEKALEVQPDTFTKDFARAIRKTVKDKQRVLDILAEVKKHHKDQKKIRKILDAVPKELASNPAIVQVRGTYLPTTWPKKSIAIYTGETALDPWGPWSLKEGIGGSEEAIIRIVKHLQKEYKVVVYGNVGNSAGVYDGVQWRNHWECNPKDTFDIFVAWRNPFIFDKHIQARKTYLWLHDVMDTIDFTEERLANIDRVMMLSQYHRTCYPMVPEDKVFYTGNGIDPEEFAALDDLKRDPHKVIYQSSHVRGLKNLYDIWPKVRQAVPDATLHVQYGWDSYDKINAGNPERLEWKEMMVQKAHSLPGVTEHGKVGQDVVAQTASTAGIWAYPTEFPEIFCITAVKAQAAGAIPVCSDYAALDEMVQYGDKMSFDSSKDLDKFADRLIWWLKHPEKQAGIRQKMKAWARTKSWENTARGWLDDFAQ